MLTGRLITAWGGNCWGEALSEPGQGLVVAWGPAVRRVIVFLCVGQSIVKVSVRGVSCEEAERKGYRWDCPHWAEFAHSPL